MFVDHETRALLSRVLAGLGVTLVLPACSPRLVIDGDDEAADDESSEGESGMETESGTSSSDTDESSSSSDDADDASDSGETEEDTVTDWDIGPPPDAGGPCMGEYPRLFEIDTEIPERCLDPRNPDPSNVYTVCYQPLEGMTCDEEIYSIECLSDASCLDITCGPMTIDGACCYMGVGGCAPGRGFLVAGEPVSATRTSDASWLQPETPELDDLDPDTRATLADVWANDGLAEHASVASFARFTAQLIGLGAPPDLVAASVRASADEVRHARRCFGFASAYAGKTIGPGALELSACVGGQPLELDAVAIDLAIEGCIVETVSTLLIAAARDRASDPAVRAALAEVARDEQDHVVLAWQALAWMVGRGGPELRRKLAATFERAESWVRSEPIERAGDRDRLRAHGYLSTRERRAIALRVIDRLVMPAARALLQEGVAPESVGVRVPSC